MGVVFKECPNQDGGWTRGPDSTKRTQLRERPSSRQEGPGQEPVQHGTHSFERCLTGEGYESSIECATTDMPDDQVQAMEAQEQGTTGAVNLQQLLDPMPPEEDVVLSGELKKSPFHSHMSNWRPIFCSLTANVWSLALILHRPQIVLSSRPVRATAYRPICMRFFMCLAYAHYLCCRLCSSPRRQAIG